MKLILLVLLTGSFLQVSAQKDEWKKNYEARWDNYDGGTQLLVTNDNLLPVTYFLDYNTKNLKQNIPNGSYIVVPTGAVDFPVIKFETIDRKKKWEFKGNKTLSYYGDLTDTEYDMDYIYDLPFEKGAAFKIGQGYDGDISHRGKFAIDFDMPVNTPIHAAREGVVVEVVKNNLRTCGKPSCAEFNNYIRILHDDGTIMQYLHLKRNGAIVKPRDIVSKGEHIGYSGNVGWSTGPHLHIDLYLTDKNNKYKTLETKFKIEEGKIVTGLEHKKTYSKDY
jgi:murein DD-endopeptidase MepM/ murein hydrolase activator NlpD